MKKSTKNKSLYLNISIPEVQFDQELNFKTETNMHPIFMVHLLEEFILQIKNTKQWEELSKNVHTTLAEAEPDSNTNGVTAPTIANRREYL